MLTRVAATALIGATAALLCSSPDLIPAVAVALAAALAVALLARASLGAIAPHRRSPGSLSPQLIPVRVVDQPAREAARLVLLSKPRR